MRGHREAETARLRCGDRLPMRSAIRAAIQTAMVLQPQRVGLRGARGDAVHVLDVAIEAPLGRHVGAGVQSFRGVDPCASGIARLPHAAAGDGDRHVIAIARVHEDGVDARVVVATAEPSEPLGPQPQAFDQPPAPAAVLRHEQARRQGAGPQPPPARFQRPHHVDRPWHRVVLPLAFRGLGRKRGRGHVLPAGAAVAASLDLHAEVPEAQRGVERAVLRVAHDLRHGVAGELRAHQLPPMARGREHEQALAGGDEQVLHFILR